VGATQGVNEVATNFTGGGFSNYFTQPDYQKNAVSKFLTGIGSQNKGLFKYVHGRE
jgi:tripeptidyl-peptidase-1